MISRDEICQEIKAAGLDSGFKGWTLVFLAAVLIGGGVFLIGAWGPQPERAWQIFLVNYLFWSGMAFGSVLFSAALVITKARWGRPIKRLAEAPVAFLPLAFLLFWVLFLGREKLFPWIQHPLPFKAAWLNIGFLFARDGIALFMLTAISLGLVYFSVRGEKKISSQGIEAWERFRDQGKENLRKQAILAPILAILYALTLSLIGFDLVMSLSPHWYSTLFGMYFFTGAFYSAIAALIFISIISVKRFQLGNFIQKNQFHDLGKLLLAFCLTNGDFFFSQFLVIWYGNLPEETRFVINRVNFPPWNFLAWTVLVLFFIVPFGTLLSKKVKMKHGPMLVLTGLILIGMWLERFLLVVPSLWKKPGLPLGLSEFLISLGFLGLMALSLQCFFKRFPLLPLTDPIFLDTLDAGREEGRG
jgi:Ni/Fe-hydrogenase subunit HybB-like protein